MALLPVRIYGDPVLRRKAQPVEAITPEIRELADDMAQTMFEAPGIGLAAPQIGESIRLIVIDPTFGDDPGQYVGLVNPVLSSPGKSTEVIEEGCLSLPDLRADVTRPDSITADFTSLDGEPVHVEAEGMLARLLQHEYDHLEGILFVDRISPLRRQLFSRQLKAFTRQAKRPAAASRH